ncbi:MAG: ATP-binding cassette domain-containing protein [Gemmatimonadota bacterium]
MTDSPPSAIRISGLRKTFRVKSQQLEAVRGIDLTVAAGEIFGFLGPNGAGKTTTLRILTTLLPADAGEAWVAGADVRREPGQVRRRIGYVGQLGGADGSATGRENLLLQGRLYGMTAAGARQRAAELIGALDLGSFADRVARSYSGGQRRRLEVALGIMHRPQVLFLDEPTTGLDPQNRASLWEQLRGLRASGTTVFLTTHYLDEADQLSDRLAIIDHGAVIAEGTPGELKQRSPGGTVAITPALPATELPALAAALAAGPFSNGASTDGGTIRLSATEPARAMAAALSLLADRGIRVRGASVAEPSLDDVFLSQTGRSLRDAGPPAADQAAAGERMGDAA